MGKDNRPRGFDSNAAHDPVELVLSMLPDAKPSGNGWAARCPAHDDQHASLGIARGPDGRALLHCHAKCTTEEVCAALGIKIADLFPAKRTGYGKSPKAKASCRIVAEYDYKDERGELLFQVVRFDSKDFRQRQPNGKGGFVWNLNGVHRVLYRLPELLRADPKAWVFIVEGEKDADALAEVGLVATTNPGGAGKWKHVDDKALCGRKVCILPHNDEAGEKHAYDVAQRLHGRAADVKVLELHGLPDKGDVSDWLRTNDATELADLADAAPSFVPVVSAVAHPESSAWEPPLPLDTFQPPEFPLEAIPEELCALCAFCAAVAESYQVPVDAVVMLALAVAGASLAKSIEVEVKTDWREPVNIFSVVAMPSGERKSAVFRAVSAPLSDFEREENERLAPQIEKNRVERVMLSDEWKAARNVAAKSKKPEERQSARERVLRITEELRQTEELVPLQLVADDATPEAVAKLLHEQHGRLALLSPEGDVFDLMAGRYSDGVSRLGTYLKGHAGDDIRVDRIGRGREYVRSPALTVGLAVQPDVLAGLLEKPALRGRGLLARFLYSLPNSKVGYRELDPPPVPEHVSSAYARLIGAALRLQPAIGADDKRHPHIVRVGAQARTELNRFRERVELELRITGELSALRDWGSKLPGAVCRIAGIFHGLMHAANASSNCSQIEPETMLCAIAVGEYAVEHAKAAFGLMGADRATSLARRILDWLIADQRAEFSRRDAFTALRGTVHRVVEVDAPLALLTEHGHIRERPTERTGAGRRPSPVYDVNSRIAAQNAHNTQNTGVGSDGAQFAQAAIEVQG